MECFYKQIISKNTKNTIVRFQNAKCYYLASGPSCETNHFNRNLVNICLNFIAIFSI